MKTYRNIFAELGYSTSDIDRKLNQAWDAVFTGPARFYGEGPEADEGYLTDTGNNDVRTEGQSYGMMMAVQMDRKDIFDKIWKWSRTHMFMKEGKLKGYFAWSCKLSGEKNAWGPAPDGEEYFAMALFTAASRWGDGEGIYEYSREARELLHTCLHHEAPMWNADNKQILFVPAADFTDPSYHLPHFYEVFAEKAEEADRSFWKEAAAASRSLIAKSCHPVTGLAPEYSAFDGSPHPVKWSDNEEHGGDFYSDAYRVAYNIGLDALWCGPSKPLSEAAARLQAFFADVDPSDYCRYSLDGGRLASSYLHPVGLIATTAAATPATLGVGGLGEAADRNAEKLVRLFWDTPPRKGVRRYYDNCLYHFAALLLSGRYQPDAAAS